MFGVSLKPKYARTLYTVVLAAQKEIRKAQKIHYSYNVPAIIHIYEKDEQGDWKSLDKRNVDISHIS